MKLDKSICGAKTRKGTPCRTPPMPNGKCYRHGGATPRGEASPHFKHGKFSKHMPTRLGAIYEDLQQNGELVSIDRNLLLREAFLREGLETLKDAGDPAQAWVDMKKCLDDLNLAIDALSEPLMKKSARKMSEIIDQRYRYHETVKELNKTLTEQRQDIKAKASIELAKENAISPSELMTLIAGFMSVINSIVIDREMRFAIADGIDKLFNTPKTSDIVTLERVTE